MKKQTLKAITMLVSIIVLAFATALASNAQSRTQKITARVPFDFVVGDKTLAAGEYVIGKATTAASTGILIRSSDGQHSAIRLTNAVNAKASGTQAALTFRRYGNAYYLAQVWTPGASEGRELFKSKAERAAERELARIAAESNLAQDARPEIVTIVADVEYREPTR
jgi:hypothetical protein